jgi:MFS family permease
VYTFAARGVLELLPVIADGEFGRGATGLGLLTGAAGAGALVSASFLALSADRAPTTTDIPTSVYVALLVSQILVALIAVTPSWSLMLVLIACLGASSTMVGVSLQTVIQNRLVDEMRGRVMSLWIMTGFGMAALGAFAIGTVAQFTSIGAASAGSGLIGLILVSVLLLAPKGTFAAR